MKYCDFFIITFLHCNLVVVFSCLAQYIKYIKNEKYSCMYDVKNDRIFIFFKELLFYMSKIN